MGEMPNCAESSEDVRETSFLNVTAPPPVRPDTMKLLNVSAQRP